VLGDAPTRDDTLTGLRSAHGFLQGAISRQLRLKHTPTLTFEYDDTVEKAARITELLDHSPDAEEAPDS
jgi:ribosome-binding factor A